MRVTLIGSHLCPDTVAAIETGCWRRERRSSIRDILSCHRDLREYLNLRDNRPGV